MFVLALFVIFGPAVGDGWTATASIVGTWFTTVEQAQVESKYEEDGTYFCTIRSVGGQKVLKGTYSVTGASLVVRLEGKDKPIQRTWRLVDPNTLELADSAGTRSTLKRQAEADRSQETTSAPRSTGGQAQSPAAGSIAPSGSAGKPITLVLRREWEPNQRAFTVLVPQGWIVTGGLFSVDPGQAGGALNAIDTKCDLAIKSDANGTVIARWAPSYNFVDFSRSAEFANLAMLFPAGRYYNGALVKPMPTVEEYLMEGFRTIRPQASNVEVVQRMDLPKAVEICQAMTQQLNASLQPLGKAPMVFSAGALVIDYTEAGTRYREAGVTCLSDWRMAAGLWSNQFTFHMRAPAAEANDFKPMLDIIRQSMKVNPEWLAAYMRSVGERGQVVADVFRHMAKIDREIFERRSSARSAMAEENYLLLTGQEDYVNPFTKEVERDSSDYKYRWTNPNGDRLFTNQNGFDPNRESDLNKIEWKQTPTKPR